MSACDSDMYGGNSIITNPPRQVLEHPTGHEQRQLGCEPQRKSLTNLVLHSIVPEVVNTNANDDERAMIILYSPQTRDRYLSFSHKRLCMP